MSHCKYHPLLAATYECGGCGTHSCDQCVDESHESDEVRCFVCERELKSLGAGDQIEPFWRKFQQAFRYPLTTSTLLLVFALSILPPLLEYLPFAIVWQLMVTGMLMKYAFSCLQQTSEGKMTPPDVTEAYGGGITLVLQLFAIFIVLGVMVGVIAHFVGPGGAILAGCLVTAALPAVVIIFGMSGSITRAINPAEVFTLIKAIGLPYGLALAIIFVMMGSVQVLSQIVSDDLSMLSLTLNSIISNYYMIVTFHLLGYMLFQYQAQLGYTAREQGASAPDKREKQAWTDAKLQVLIKEGQFQRANKLFTAAIKETPSNNRLYSRYFEFLMATSNTRDSEQRNYLTEFASSYLQRLASLSPHQMLLDYRRLTKVVPSYKPNSPYLRLTLAEASSRNGDSPSALKLLNGIRKDFPNFEKLVEAYELTAKILERTAGMEEQAKKCRKLLAALIAQRGNAAAAV